MSDTNNKLWQGDHGSVLEPLIEKYTIGNDHIWDQQLLGYDIQASRAHGGMLHAIGTLSDDEWQRLAQTFDDLYAAWKAGNFVIQEHQEDSHTAIEHHLVEALGDTGKKINTARSRNDQVLVMMRLYLKDSLREILAQTAGVVDAFTQRATQAGSVPMPGYTHMQKAMPTTVATWLGSFGDGFSDLQKILIATLEVIDQNPLGSAAGFGVSLKIDREQTTKALGFHRTQENPMYCAMSRGYFELLCLQTLNPVMVLAGKFARDMLLFTGQEFEFFSLPDSFTTGSSIMPHKHNYDLFEIMRGHSSSFPAHAQQLQAIVGSIGSSYQRDLQLTKEITVKALSTVEITLEVLTLAVKSMKLNEANLRASITEEMLSVTEINKLVEQGVPFRDAYNQIKSKLNNQA